MRREQVVSLKPSSGVGCPSGFLFKPSRSVAIIGPECTFIPDVPGDYVLATSLHRDGSTATTGKIVVLPWGGCGATVLNDSLCGSGRVQDSDCTFDAWTSIGQVCSTCIPPSAPTASMHYVEDFEFCVSVAHRNARSPDSTIPWRICTKCRAETLTFFSHTWLCSFFLTLSNNAGFDAGLRHTISCGACDVRVG